MPKLERTDRVLREVLFMQPVRQYGRNGAPVVYVYEMGDGGPAAGPVAVEPDLPFTRQGAGGAHHVAFRTTEAEYPKWAERLEQMGMPSSGPVNRFYFQSLYFREPNGILFEIATDEPGFTAERVARNAGPESLTPTFPRATPQSN